MDGLYRSPSFEFSAGERVELSDCTFEIVEVTGDGRPLSLRVRFGSALEATDRRFVVWQRDGFEDFALPPVGSSAELEPTTLVRLLFGR
jgi:hypothetical protein